MRKSHRTPRNRTEIGIIAQERPGIALENGITAQNVQDSYRKQETYV